MIISVFWGNKAMKSINYNEKTKVFTLRTKNSMYQMQVVEYETLVHLYYGADIGDTEASREFDSLISKK